LLEVMTFKTFIGLPAFSQGFQTSCQILMAKRFNGF